MNPTGHVDSDSIAGSRKMNTNRYARMSWRVGGTAVLTAALLAGITGNAFADNPQPTSDKVYGIGQGPTIPADGVLYPVATLIKNYTKDAGSTQYLNNGVKSILTATDAKSDTNTVSNVSGWTFGGEINVGKVAGPIGPDGKTPLAEVGSKISFGYKNETTVADSTTVTFTTANSITLKPHIDGMTATPTYFRQQLFADIWRHPKDGDAALVKKSGIQGDYVRGEGWLLDCGNRVCVPGKDFESN